MRACPGSRHLAVRSLAPATRRGAFHETTPQTNNYVRAKAAFCNKFVPFTVADFKKAKPLAGTAEEKPPTFKGAAPAGITVNGNGTVWQVRAQGKGVSEAMCL